MGQSRPVRRTSQVLERPLTLDEKSVSEIEIFRQSSALDCVAYLTASPGNSSTITMLHRLQQLVHRLRVVSGIDLLKPLTTLPGYLDTLPVAC